MDRRRLLLVGAALGLVVILAGLLLAGAIKSPATVAAQAEPPPMTVLTEPAVSRVLTQSLFVAGTVEPRTVYEARAIGSTEAGRTVYTAVHVKRGDRVGAGRRLAEVSGRPIIVLPGSFPGYRDLLPGAEGKDVAQLQRALRARGWYRERVSGVMDSGTKAAVSRMYGSMGYRPIEVGLDELESAEQQATSARRTLAEANAALGAAQRNSPDRGALVRAVDYAREDLVRALEASEKAADAAGPTLPVAEYLFVPTLPATVLDVPATVGAEASGVAVRLSSGALIVRGQLDPVQLKTVAAGQRAEIVTGDTRLAGHVELVEDAPPQTVAQADGPGVSQPQQASAVIVPDSPIAGALLGAPARVVVTAKSSDTPVLSVPVTAVVSKSSGVTVVVVRQADGETREVEVRTGFLGDGYVEIQPTTGTVNDGDQIVVSSRGGAHVASQSGY